MPAVMRRLRSGRPRRPMDWEYALGGATLGSPDDPLCAWILPPEEVRAEYTDPTLMATRIFASARLAITQTFDLGAIAVGIIAWAAAEDADILTCPGPITHGDLDWITRAVATFPSGTPAGTLATLTLDSTHLSKARRRLGNTQGILISFESSEVVGSMTCDVRLLIKE